jgi:hypothetical protein
MMTISVETCSAAVLELWSRHSWKRLDHAKTTASAAKSSIFLDIALVLRWKSINVLEEPLNPEDGGDLLLRNVYWLSPDYTELHPRGENSSQASLREPQTQFGCNNKHRGEFAIKVSRSVNLLNPIFSDSIRKKVNTCFLKISCRRNFDSENPLERTTWMWPVM